MANQFGDGEFEQKFLIPELVSQIQANSGENVFVQMADELQGLVAKVLQTGKGGSVTLKVAVRAVRFKGANKDDWSSGQVDVDVQVRSQVPKPVENRPLQGRFYIREDGWLSPIQARMGDVA